MHSLLMVLVVTIALGLRWPWRTFPSTWNSRWHYTLIAFCLPLLWLVAASIAVLAMGHHGAMMGLPVSPLGCCLGIMVLSTVFSVVAYSLLRAWWLSLKVQHYPLITLPSGDIARLLDSDPPIAAQVGFWNPCLVISRGWLEGLTVEEQQAMLRHEQAHCHFQDPFWFFWLGIVRRLTLMLPYTTELWEELLLLREIRADRWAARDTDPLLLAELLVKLVRGQQQGHHDLPGNVVGFSHEESLSRLEQRIEALLNPDYLKPETTNTGQDFWWLSTVIPLMAICLHH
jgi:Zn-dependent protease with chaperone function